MILFLVDLLSPATEGMMVTHTTLACKAPLRNGPGWITSAAEALHTRAQSHTATATLIYCATVSLPSLPSSQVIE